MCYITSSDLSLLVFLFFCTFLLSVKTALTIHGGQDDVYYENKVKVLATLFQLEVRMIFKIHVYIFHRASSTSDRNMEVRLRALFGREMCLKLKRGPSKVMQCAND